MGFGTGDSGGGGGVYPASDLRNTGFGLNYNRGFNTLRQGFMPSLAPAQQQLQNAQDMYRFQKESELQKALQGNQLGSEAALQQGRLASQEKLAGQAQTGETERARIAAAAATAPTELKRDLFNQVFPWLQGELGGLGLGTFGGQGPYTIGGASPPSPEITVGGVLSPDQIQQQVNATRAQNDAQAAQQQQTNAQNLAGRGFSSSSPLLALLNQNAAMNAQGVNTQAEQQLRLDAAQQNAQHLLSTQQAREQQFATRQNEAIERAKPYFARQNALIQALTGLI